MLATSSAPRDPDRIDIAFATTASWTSRGLRICATLAQHLGLQELADSCVDLGDAPARANAGDNCLDRLHRLSGARGRRRAPRRRRCVRAPAAASASVLGCTASKAPPTLGVFLRSFSWGHVRQLDRLSRKLLARAWAAEGGDQARRRSRSTSTRRSARPYGLRERGRPAATATRACAAITRYRPQTNGKAERSQNGGGRDGVTC